MGDTAWGRIVVAIERTLTWAFRQTDGATLIIDCRSFASTRKEAQYFVSLYKCVHF